MSAFLKTSKNGTEVPVKVCMGNVSFKLKMQNSKNWAETDIKYTGTELELETHRLSK